MNPVTGPIAFESEKNLSGPLAFFQEAKRYRQVPPYDLDLPYQRIISKVLSCVDKSPTPYNPFANASYVGAWNGVVVNFITLAKTIGGSNRVTQLVNIAKNDVYEKIVGEMADKVELMVSLAERREAYAMVVQRLGDLHQFVHAITCPDCRPMQRFFSRRQLTRQAKIVLQSKLRNWRKSTKEVGQTWLELHFGWEPIVKDIDTICQLMSDPLPEGEIKVKSRKLDYGFDYSTERANPFDKTRSACSGSVQAFGTVTIRVDDRDRAYASVLGLNNPALTAYSLIPYSWMFDWVSYLGTYLSSFSDMAGYTALSASHAVKFTAAGISNREYPRGTTMTKNTWSGVYFERWIGIPSVTLTWRALPKRLSVIRGSTLASLIAGKLNPKYIRYKPDA